MKIIDTKFSGLKIVKQVSIKDKRGQLRIIHNQKIKCSKIISQN